MWKANEYYLCLSWVGEFFTAGKVYKCIRDDKSLRLQCNSGSLIILTVTARNFVPATELTKALT